MAKGGGLAVRPRATLKTLADHLDLSVTTVSRALKDGEEVKPETIARVKEAAAKLGYRPNTSGIGLKTGKTYVIALIMPVIKPGEIVGDVGTLPLIEGLTAALANTPYHLTIIPRRPEQDDLEPVKYVVEHGLADGLILNITRSEDERVKYLNAEGVPFVTFGRTELAIQHPYYDIDNADFTHRAAQFMIDRGRRRLMMLTPPREFLYSWHRQVGFKRALMEAGLEFDEERQIVIEGNAVDYRALSRSLAEGDWTPDGYVCGTEISAMGIMAGLHDAGVRVGEDCDVVTMETSPLPDYFRIPISGFHQDLHHVGRKLCQLLLDAMEHRKPVEQLQVIETAEFINRTDRTS
ncbi:LacI family transcriptional regulator [Saccharospirillum salsuginis]|uniref:Transcriptional regulator n=1 Tax=Saccharospirillum salsuginis TaxID=418750 RepID=A0A918N7Y7_9GAMM|nr:LacI family transcriptional regulator [Saccharospirillum salsuginis]GGX49154.1 transcriptional regulator [Saccharospirillum salsuginis]